jgi:uncharacterized protein with FMN-binding domain
MRHLQVIAIAWVAFGAFAPARADELAMQDLKALDAQHAWSELLGRADQVKPSARDASWKQLVVSAATHVVDAISTDTATSVDTARALIEVVPPAERKYPFVREDRGYLAAKGKALERVVSLCKQNDHRGCGVLVGSLAAGVDHFAKGTAREIAMLVSDDIGPAEAMHFWTLAVADDPAACKEIGVERAVIAALSVGGDRVADAQKTAIACFASLESALTQELIATSDNSPYAKNACPVLKPRGAMTVLKKKKCS